MRDTARSTIAPHCTVSRRQLAHGDRHRTEAAEAARLQRQFEHICARELRGDTD
ncbi:hypothetical protein OK349_19215 [Sphingomonas sp. BT-65]|uniref:hypothetical protein n=1 Tax=Sphingomonas sp. BT-65 TaxID=2989821 RepID=UPI00223642B2|nr:hypothetical protein [Sphingomonas sp. BT-65]MCW4463841.1 hypothetical protein [Sphingomonas sp. BT-65]